MLLSLGLASDDATLDVHTSQVDQRHQKQQQQQRRRQRACDSSRDDRATSHPLTGSTVNSAGSRLVPQTSSDCPSSSSGSTAVTTECAVSATTAASALHHSSPTPPTICPPLYSLYPPCIVMGISVQPFTFPLDVASRLVTGSRKRRGSKLLPPEVKRRADRKRRRLQRGDVALSTMPKTTSGHLAYPFPLETMSSSATATREAEVTSPVCLAVSRDRLVYDSCGALDLTVRK